MMKSFVFVAFVLFALVPLTDAACWLVRHSRGANLCQDDLDKTWHPIGAKWVNSKCFRCTCGVDEMECCHTFPFASGSCTIKHDYDSCTYELIYPDDRLPCALAI